jgi:aspartyl-tRNA(Asn)/glutamyl-tRNA(Gln) amidotransferase subunit A
VRTLIKRDFEKAFEQVDIIAAPVAPTTAFKIGENVNDPIKMYLEDVFTLPLSLSGFCGISVPCGFDQNNLPIGLQLMGPAFGEATILNVAQAYQQTTEWHLKKPNRI